MPQTYMRTSPGISGLNSCFSPVRELWILSMQFEAPARYGRRNELEQRREFRAVQLSGQCDAQRHEKVRAFATSPFLEELGQLLEIRARFTGGRSRSGEKSGSGRLDDATLLVPERRQFAADR